MCNRSGQCCGFKECMSVRAFWNLARVEELVPSKHGVIRAARVRVVNSENSKSSYLRRPIQHLIPLEVRSTSEDRGEANQPTQNSNEDIPTERIKSLKHRYSLRSTSVNKGQ